MPLIELLIMKRAMLDEGEKTWMNLHTFDAPGDLNRVTAPGELNFKIVAEQHILLGHAQIIGAAVWKASPITPWNQKENCYATARIANGGRNEMATSEPLPWEYGYMIDKNSVVGRRGHSMFRQCLTVDDVNVFIDGTVALKPAEGVNDLGSRYYHEFMLMGEWSPVMVSRVVGSDEPILARPILAFAHGRAVKLRSIEDAQRRKTALGLGFKALAFEKVNDVLKVTSEFERIITSYGELVPGTEIENLKTLAAEARQAMRSIAEYWDEGLRPMFAAEWRPHISGLDPLSHLSFAALGSGIIAAQSLEGALASLEGDEQGNIGKIQLMSHEWHAFAMQTAYFKMLHYERWTGTPIPHSVQV